MFRKNADRIRIEDLEHQRATLRQRLTDATFEKVRWMEKHQALELTKNAEIAKLKLANQASHAAYKAVADKLGEVARERDRLANLAADRFQDILQLSSQLNSSGADNIMAADIAAEYKAEADELKRKLNEAYAKTARAESQRDYVRGELDRAMERKEAVQLTGGDVDKAKEVVAFVNPPKQAKAKKRKPTKAERYEKMKRSSNYGATKI